MISLRDYQSDIINRLRPSLAKHRSSLVVLPTGGGKTALASFILHGCATRKTRAWFIVHRAELIYQTSLTLTAHGIVHSFIAAGLAHDPSVTVQLVSFDTLKSRIDSVDFPELCIWDEAHHIVARTWLETKETLSKALHIGLTATPELLSGAGLGLAFPDMVQGPTVKNLISRGFLAHYDFFGPALPDLTDVKSERGDYSANQIAKIMSQPRISGNILESWKTYGLGRITIGFAASRATSQMYADQFNAAGIPSAHIDSTTPKAIRQQVAKQLASGEIRVLWNVNLLGEGYDLSAQAGTNVTIDVVIDAAPTQSLAKFLQRCGRALRPKADGSKAVIIDCAGNWQRHKLPCSDRQWSLDAVKRVKADNDNVLIRQCGECFNVHEPAPTCPFCGYVHPVKSRKEMQSTDAELKRIEAEEHERKLRELDMEIRMCRTLDDFKRVAQKAGYAPGWAWHRYNARKGKKAG